MAFFRQYISPLLILLIFLIALAAVSVRSFLPSDMAAPAPIEEGDLAAGGTDSPSQSAIPSLQLTPY